MSEENGTKHEEKEQSKPKKEGFALLLDSSYPLLNEFREKCPGTYKHSQALASMVENVASSLDLNVDAMKVAALYHDIGKIFNPKAFTENQLEDENIHDTLDPKISFEIITRHVSDSVMILLNDENFPRELIEIISQHHGNTVLKYFYSLSAEKNPDDFRYHCARPKNVESMVLMICDQIEATSRSMVQSGNFDPGKVIDGTINGLIDDGQLDDVVLRFGDLRKIKQALAKELEGTYQKRVSYDVEELNEKE